ncbi:MAG: M23 family metallopeptidase [Chloroflexi bacterium]|nr:M23 family metallopeptidase [Chloroflexota bacterium]
MDYQIILLPNDNYWEWVRACRDYVMTYGPNLTMDPGVAARYMAPQQVVTFPNAPSAYVQSDDMVRWLDESYPGVRVDPVATDTPAGLEAEFRDRIAAHDRYGQKRRPFYLVWPTDYPVVTQIFGANPQIYSRYGVPAHEGLDIRALTNTNVCACFDGEVYEVHKNPKDHAYGIHVRIRHRDGYRTVYGHLARALVSVGEEVREGQLIGKADSTGASAGAHLHLTLKQDGATARAETDYPKDIIDPTPFMVWPENRVRKSAKSAVWVAERCLLGACGRVGGSLQEEDFACIQSARLDAMLLPMEEDEKAAARLRAINPAMLIAVTLSQDFSGAPVSPEGFVQAIRPHLARWAVAGVVHFQVHTNPNLLRQGWRRTWQSGSEFAGWFSQVIRALREIVPGARFGFPGLAPGDTVSGQRADSLDFLLAAENAAQEADWLGANCFWTEPAGALTLQGVGLLEEYRRLFPDKVLLVTEFGNASQGVDPTEKARQYLDFHSAAGRIQNVGAAFGYALSSSGGNPGLAWRAEGESTSRLAERLGQRSV